MNDRSTPEGAPESAARLTIPSLAQHSPRAQRYDRVVDRRRAQRDLDRILGCPSRPNIAETYGLTS